MLKSRFTFPIFHNSILALFPIASVQPIRPQLFCVPDLPGCFFAGDTLDEAIDNARDAIDFHCESMIVDGIGIPPSKSN